MRSIRTIVVVILLAILSIEGAFLIFQMKFSKEATTAEVANKNQYTLSSTTDQISSTIDIPVITSLSADTSVMDTAKNMPSTNDMSDVVIAYQTAWNSMLKSIKSYNAAHNISYYTLGEVRALNYSATEIIVITNEILKNTQGTYMSDIPPMQLTSDPSQSDKNLILPQILYLPTSNTSYELCQYSLIDIAEIVPTCYSSTEAVASLRLKYKNVPNLFTKEFLQNYGINFDKNFASDTQLGEKKDDPTQINAYDDLGEKTISRYSSDFKEYYTDFVLFTNNILENSTVFGNKEASTVIKQNWENEFVQSMLIPLIVAYENEYGTYPKSLEDFLPAGYILKGSYTLSADGKNFIFCASTPNGIDESQQHCISKVDAIQIFTSSQFPTSFLNNNVSNAIVNTRYVMKNAVYEDINLQLGLVTLSRQMSAFQMKYGRFPNSIDEFTTEFKTDYGSLISDGVVTLAGKRDTVNSKYIITYTVKNRGTFSIEFN